MKNLKNALKFDFDYRVDLFCKMDLEEFVPIHGFERYAISKSGNIMIIKTGRIRKQNIRVNPDGYKSVRVSLVKDDGTDTSCIVARLLAKTFIPNPENKPQVDHIDRNSTNNDLTNLRWFTPKEQNLNRNMPLSSSGHRHIHKSGDGWMLWNPELKTYSKTFKSLDDAIAAKAIMMPEE